MFIFFSEFFMAFFEWDDSLSVNIKEIDTQHKQLIKLINLLHYAIEKEQGTFILGETLSDLINYTVSHFSSEERFMLKYDYPLYNEHKIEHDILTAQVKELDAKFKSGDNFICPQVMNILKDWLEIHIKSVDNKFGIFLNEIGIE